MTTFQPKGLGLTIFNDRYAHDGETYDEACMRVATAISQAEGKQEDRTWAMEQFYDVLSEGLFMPGGRIWYGAGRRKQQMLNCFVVPTQDSREGWGTTFYDLTTISGTGGGVGFNFSPVRYRGAPIKGTGGESTGSVSLMHACNNIGDQMIGGGNRRTAMMMCLDIDHPDIYEFIEAKLNKGALTNANVSVIIPPGLGGTVAALYREGGSIPLQFNDQYVTVTHEDTKHDSVNVREFLHTIIGNALQAGEPGILNRDFAERESNVHYLHPLTSTNPCGEIWLPDYGCCCLGAIVLPRFIDEEGEVDWRLLKRTVHTAVRFLDNVLTVNHYPQDRIRKMCLLERRIGLGVMGLHSMLLDLGMTYDSGVAHEFVGDLFNTIMEAAYAASVDLAMEKAPFPGYDPAFLDSGFASRLGHGLRKRIETHGIRNCAILTVAPTGTTSMVHGVTSGIEPLFAPAYVRRHYVAGVAAGQRELTETLVIHNDYLNHPELAQGAYDISVADHLSMQALVQYYVDNAVSKTINVPAGTTLDEVCEHVVNFLPYVKGVTLYQEGTRDDEPMQAVRRSDIDRMLVDWTGNVDYEGLDSLDCVSGVCST